jgi:signal transduction histidine kinase
VKRLKPSRSALRVAILYALVASLQILLSRWLIGILVPDPDQRLLAETFEQLGFLVVITVLLYFLVRGELRAHARTENALHASEEQLSESEEQQRRVEKRTEELTTLLRVSRQMTSTLDFEELLERILTEMEKTIEYAAASILILEDGQLRTVCYHGSASQETAARGRLSIDRWGELWSTMARGETLIVGDTQADTLLAQTYRQVTRYLGGDFSTARTWMGIPLIVGGHTIGALSIEHDQPHAYTSSHAEMALAVANQAAIAIENARLYKQARRLAVMEERQRLARELHDSVSQALYSIALGTHTALALLEREDPVRAAKPLEYVLSLADAALAEMRALIFELRPDALEKEGLVAALSRHAEAILARHHLAVETAFCEEPSAPPDVKEALYRIAVELMNNAVKHAQATRISLRLQAQHGMIILEVQDDGVGFDPQGEYPGHLGLRSMRERAAQIGAALEIESASGRGTQVQVRVYLPNGT